MKYMSFYLLHHIYYYIRTLYGLDTLVRVLKKPLSLLLLHHILLYIYVHDMASIHLYVCLKSL
jgi:hypothetical protein